MQDFNAKINRINTKVYNMNVKVYNRLVSKWKKPIYKNPVKKKNKNEMKKILDYIYLLRNTKVVDIGSNAGVFTYNIAKYAQEFMGVESDLHFYDQSLVTSKYIKIPGKFVNSTVLNFIKTTDFDYNAIFASRILYHLTKDEIDLIREVMLPKCDIVLFISREDKNKNKNPYKLNKWVNIEKFLMDVGMQVDTFNTKSNWVSIIGYWP